MVFSKVIDIVLFLKQALQAEVSVWFFDHSHLHLGVHCPMLRGYYRVNRLIQQTSSVTGVSPCINISFVSDSKTNQVVKQSTRPSYLFVIIVLFHFVHDKISKLLWG